VETNPDGYVAPPLDGIWASAPYFHNGSVSDALAMSCTPVRPSLWKPNEDGFDREKVGLEIETFERIPAIDKSAVRRRRYFDTSLPGKSPQGHLFPDELSEDEKQAVLEYLKSI